MRKIAITQRLIENDKYFEIREALDINFSKLIKNCGFLPIILPYNIDFNEFFKSIDIHGVIFTGGNDLDLNNSNKLSFKRDQFEKKLLKFCIEKSVPVMGICRGMQLIADFFGCSFKKIDGHVNTRHNIKINKLSKYSNYLKKNTNVNSFHNYTIDKLSDQLIISASDEKNEIEAFEHVQHKIYGQMWHTEREYPIKKSEINFIKNYFNDGIDDVIKIASKASKVIMNSYEKEFKIDLKDDNSPLTNADLLSNQIIIKELKKISNYPIITEENPIDYRIRKNYKKYWLVDPLDGTKDFIAKNDQFTVNIALILNRKPILGVVYIPATDDFYWALKNIGSYKNNKVIKNNSSREKIIGAKSNFHSTKEEELFFKKFKISKILRFGSAIKLCKLAEGEIDVYPRLNGTMEWDTAAPQIIASEAGCKLIDIETKKELRYNKKTLKNNSFIASREDLNFIK